MRINEVSTILKSAIPAGLNVLLVGAPGVGKTDIVRQAAAELKMNLAIDCPAVRDPTDYGGLPFPSEDGKSARFLPFGFLHQAMKATETKRMLWFLDDLGQAREETQSAIMPLIHGGQGGENIINPKFVSFVAATNRKEDRAGVRGLLEPVKSRFHTILNVDVHIDDWTAWAYQHDVHPYVLATLRNMPSLLLKFTPSADMVQSPSPRSWKHASDICKLGIPESSLMDAIIGTVGIEGANALMAMIVIGKDLPDPHTVLQDGKRAPIPQEASARYALCEALIAVADLDTFGGFCEYTEKLYEKGHGEFTYQMLMAMVSKHAGKFQNSPGFNNLLNNQKIIKLINKVLGK